MRTRHIRNKPLIKPTSKVIQSPIAILAPPHEMVSIKGVLYAKEKSNAQDREWLHSLYGLPASSMNSVA